jgi:sialate O-acetylesterase
MPAGGPYELRVSCEGQTIEVRDVHVGEVWLASGQSNMEWPLWACNLKLEKAAVEESRLRMITVNHTAMVGERADFEGCWQTATLENVKLFSAVGYFFARRLCEELGVAVGIVNSSWGGTVAEAWTSREELAQNPDYAPWMHRYHANVNFPGYWESAGVPQGSPFPADPGNLGLARGWAGLAFDDQAWPEMMLPGTWQAAGHGFSGVFWFRKTVDIPADWAGRDLTLDIGAVDKQDTTYFNGEQIGATGKGFEQEFWNVNRSYRVPGRLVRPGRNVVTVRAYSFAYAGGLIGPASEMELAPEADACPSIPLSGAWRYQVEHDLGLVFAPGAVLGEGSPNSPHMLFDNMIKPLLPYGLRGAIWYQGESNADAADKYRNLIVEMVRCWRHAWGQGDFAFLQVQLANYMAPTAFQPHSEWARLREAQLQATQEPGVGMAVAIDIGEAGDIHPKNKRDVGHRLAQWALARTYGRPLVPSGPLYAHMTIEGGRIRIYFDHADHGLVASGGALKTFVIAGADRRFVEAGAVIEGNTVVVSAGQVPEPMAVRYAWADNPEGCNLHNAEGLPASPFRTDTWSRAGA